MSSTTSIVNKSLRKFILPVLRDSGFQKIEARNAFCWSDDQIWVFNVRSVGNYFSTCTDWPPGSISVNLSIYYNFFPQYPWLKADANNRLVPKESMGHMRKHLECNLDQSQYLSNISREIERNRKDLWWIDPTGLNSEIASQDIANALFQFGIPWLKEMSIPENALSAIELERDSFIKFTRAYHLSKKIGNTEHIEKYEELALKEANKINKSIDKNTWYGI